MFVAAAEEEEEEAAAAAALSGINFNQAGVTLRYGDAATEERVKGISDFLSGHSLSLLDPITRGQFLRGRASLWEA